MQTRRQLEILRYRYLSFASEPPNPATDNGVYLFGGNEDFNDMHQQGFYNYDINCDGNENDYIYGISSWVASNGGYLCKDNPNMSLSRNIDYTWITSNNGGLGQGDGVVRLDRQYLFGIGDTLLTNVYHTDEPSDIKSLIRGIDEPDTYQLAYTIKQDNLYRGFISYQTNYQSDDYDYYRFIANNDGNLKITIDGANSGVYEIMLRDYNGNLIENLPISSFPFTYNKQVIAGLYYICIKGHAASNGIINSYTILPTLEPLIISLYNGSVSPTSGNESTNFDFSVYYKNTNNYAPDNVQLHIVNQYTENMTAGGSNWQQGVQFTKTLNNFSPGQYQFYFSADVSGQTLRFPDTGYLNFNVTQNVAGWDLAVNNMTYTPTIVTPGIVVFSSTASVYNNSNSPDKIYHNIDYSFTFYDKIGNIIDIKTGNIPTINQYQTIPVTKSFIAPSGEGNCTLVFSVYPQIDEITSNNTLSKTVIVSSTGPQKQWLITNSNAYVLMDQNASTHNFNGHTFTLHATTSSYIQIQRDDFTTPHTINLLKFRQYDDGLVVVINESCLTTEAFVSFGLDNPNYVTYDQTNITTSPGTTIEFIASCGAMTFSAEDPYIYRNDDGLIVEPWYESYTRLNNNHSIKYTFVISFFSNIG